MCIRMMFRVINIPITFDRVERSSDQIIKPVNLAALTKWVGNIPDDVVREMADIAPMLSVLGYDPYANPPVYGAPDSLVSDNTRRYVPICYAAWLLQLLHIVLQAMYIQMVYSEPELN